MGEKGRKGRAKEEGSLCQDDRQAKKVGPLGHWIACVSLLKPDTMQCFSPPTRADFVYYIFILEMMVEPISDIPSSAINRTNLNSTFKLNSM